MSIDDEVNAEKKIGKCYLKGIYHYRSTQSDGKQYCCLSDDTCPFFKKVKSQDLCTSYDPQNKHS